jgi:hypothetical protein
MNTIKTFKKLNLKNKYLDFELEECENLLKIFQQKFTARIQEIVKDNNITLKNAQQSIANPKKPECDSTGDIKCGIDKKEFKNPKDLETFKDLYRKIAKKTHPDKTDNNEDGERILKKAMKAKDEHDLFALFDICDDLEIASPTVTKSHIKLLENTIKDKEEKIAGIQKLDAWIWHESPDLIKAQMEQKILEFLKS